MANGQHSSGGTTPGRSMAERRGSATPSYVRVETGRRTDFDEVLELHQTRARLVVIAEDLEDLGLLKVEAEGAHCDFELVVIDAAILVCVEEFKRLFDLLLLFVRELWARVGASLGFLDSCRPVHGVGDVCGIYTRRGRAAGTLGRGRREREGGNKSVWFGDASTRLQSVACLQRVAHVAPLSPNIATRASHMSKVSRVS